MAKAPSVSTGASFSSSRRDTCPNLRCVMAVGITLVGWTCLGVGGCGTASGAAALEGIAACFSTVGYAGLEGGLPTSGMFGWPVSGLLFSGSMTLVLKLLL